MEKRAISRSDELYQFLKNHQRVFFVVVFSAFLAAFYPMFIVWLLLAFISNFLTGSLRLSQAKGPWLIFNGFASLIVLIALINDVGCSKLPVPYDISFAKLGKEINRLHLVLTAG